MAEKSVEPDRGSPEMKCMPCCTEASIRFWRQPDPVGEGQARFDRRVVVFLDYTLDEGDARGRLPVADPREDRPWARARKEVAGRGPQDRPCRRKGRRAPGRRLDQKNRRLNA
jgi:hypothetical protein